MHKKFLLPANGFQSCLSVHIGGRGRLHTGPRPQPPRHAGTPPDPNWTSLHRAPCSNLFNLFKPHHTRTWTCSLYCFQAGGWHSTEMRSCYSSKLFYSKVGQMIANILPDLNPNYFNMNRNHVHQSEWKYSDREVAIVVVPREPSKN